jgi:hypothetical protein
MGRPEEPYLISITPDDYHNEWNEVLRATAATKRSEFFRIVVFGCGTVCRHAHKVAQPAGQGPAIAGSRS